MPRISRREKQTHARKMRPLRKRDDDTETIRKLFPRFSFEILDSQVYIMQRYGRLRFQQPQTTAVSSAG